MFRLFTARVKGMFVFLSQEYVVSFREQMFRVFTTLIKAIFDNMTLSSIRQQMFRHFQTGRINARFDNYVIYILENKVFVFLRRALRQYLISTLSYFREQMFRLFTRAH